MHLNDNNFVLKSDITAMNISYIPAIYRLARMLAICGHWIGGNQGTRRKPTCPSWRPTFIYDEPNTEILIILCHVRIAPT